MLRLTTLYQKIQVQAGILSVAPWLGVAGLPFQWLLRDEAGSKQHVEALQYTTLNRPLSLCKRPFLQTEHRDGCFGTSYIHTWLKGLAVLLPFKSFLPLHLTPCPAFAVQELSLPILRSVPRAVDGARAAQSQT